MKGGAYYQMLFPAKKMDLPVYNSNNKQYFSISDLEQDAEIEVLDAYENKSIVNFSIKRKPGASVVQEKTGQLMNAGELNIYDEEQIQFVFKEDAFYDDFHFSLQSTYASAAHDASPVYQTLPADIPA
jgi:hypothetical protein